MIAHACGTGGQTGGFGGLGNSEGSVEYVPINGAMPVKFVAAPAFGGALARSHALFRQMSAVACVGNPESHIWLLEGRTAFSPLAARLSITVCRFANWLRLQPRLPEPIVDELGWLGGRWLHVTISPVAVSPPVTVSMHWRIEVRSIWSLLIPAR